MDLSAVLLPVIVAVHLVAIETLAGSLLFLHAVIVPSQAAVVEGADSRLTLEPWCRKVAAGCVAVALLTMVLWLGATAASISGASSLFDFEPQLLRELLSNTQFGIVWLIRCGVALMLLLLLARPLTGRSLANDALPWAGLLLLTIATTGHAGAAEDAHHGMLLTVVGLHLAATAAWIGSLPPLVRLLVAAAAGTAAEAALAAEVVRRYAAYGGAAVAVLVASGATAAWLFTGGSAAALHSDFARVLLGKLALFGVMLALALVNRLLLSPRLAAASADTRVFGVMWRVVLLEYAVGTFVLLAAAILAQTAPPGH